MERSIVNATRQILLAAAFAAVVIENFAGLEAGAPARKGRLIGLKQFAWRQ